MIEFAKRKIQNWNAAEKRRPNEGTKAAFSNNQVIPAVARMISGSKF